MCVHIHILRRSADTQLSKQLCNINDHIVWFHTLFLEYKEHIKNNKWFTPTDFETRMKPLFHRDQLVIWVSDQQWTPFRSGHVLNMTRNQSHQLKQPGIETATVDIWRFLESRIVIILPQIYQTGQFHGTNKSRTTGWPVKAPLARLGHVFSLRPRLPGCGAAPKWMFYTENYTEKVEVFID